MKSKSTMLRLGAGWAAAICNWMQLSVSALENPLCQLFSPTPFVALK